MLHALRSLCLEHEPFFTGSGHAGVRKSLTRGPCFLVAAWDSPTRVQIPIWYLLGAQRVPCFVGTSGLKYVPYRYLEPKP